MKQIGPVITRHGPPQGPPQGLDALGLEGIGEARWNLSTPALMQLAVGAGEGLLVADGAFCTSTGRYTGRCPKDKFILDEPGAHDAIDWGQINQPIDARALDRLWAKARAHVRGRKLFVQDVFAGADPEFRLRVRVVTETAWHSLFAVNMFRRPSPVERAGFAPDFTVLQVPNLNADPATDGTRSEVAVAVDFAARTILICGTHYAGEIKKSIFGVLNYLLPARGVLPMHCSANIGPHGDVALFFGLSGTGKTTLSADPDRTLIGDDEHGWGPKGVFNFEGGCYAKVIRLSAEDEPEIHAASTRFGAILENVVADPSTGALDFDDDCLTENTRSSYPLDFIPNAEPTGMAGHPRHIVMLTADAFGVLPPISKLTPEQAMYHFLSGYTARVAGTEQGVKTPQATFSTCFGAPFMPRHPTVYARMLRDFIREHRVECCLVNTGWSGGPYGTGQRIKLAHTRAMLRAALNGGLEGVAMRRHPELGLMMPEACPGVPSAILNPRATWSDAQAYDHKARELARRFEVNFKAFAPHVGEEVKAAGIHALA